MGTIDMGCGAGLCSIKVSRSVRQENGHGVWRGPGREGGPSWQPWRGFCFRGKCLVFNKMRLHLDCKFLYLGDFCHSNTWGGPPTSELWTFPPL
jgi:hypothetical protein